MLIGPSLPRPPNYDGCDNRSERIRSGMFVIIMPTHPGGAVSSSIKVLYVNMSFC